MDSIVSRRSFMKLAAAGAAPMILPTGILSAGQSPNEKLNIALIGSGGRGRANLQFFKSENIVALCDTDEDELATTAKDFPNAKTYVDWRKCLEQKDIEAVICSTTDHTHAFVTTWALNRGMHVYCEKPLGNSVEEARVVREAYLKQKGKVATQMGVQRHENPNMARVVELIRDGAIGTPESVSLWCARTPKGGNYLPDAGQPPKNIHWDLWLGPSPHHPYNPGYLVANPSRCLSWNIYWDFGSGQMGDMGSHTMDIAWWALDLGFPTSCFCVGPEKSSDTVPTWIKAEWEHPANDWRPAVTVKWYDGGKRPGMPSKAFAAETIGDGALFKGDKGFLLCDFGARYLMPTRGEMSYYKPRKAEEAIPDSPGHHAEWLKACKTDKKTRTDFDYSGKLIEHNMLALAAYRTGEKLEWNAGELKATNCPKADQFIRKTYREGWVLNG